MWRGSSTQHRSQYSAVLTWLLAVRFAHPGTRGSPVPQALDTQTATPCRNPTQRMPLDSISSPSSSSRGGGGRQVGERSLDSLGRRCWHPAQTSSPPVHTSNTCLSEVASRWADGRISKSPALYCPPSPPQKRSQGPLQGPARPLHQPHGVRTADSQQPALQGQGTNSLNKGNSWLSPSGQRSWTR